MKRPWVKNLNVFAVALLASLFGVIAYHLPSTFASNPSTISFQGKMVNSDGTNVANGTYPFVFKLYTSASGGSAIWNETQTSVTVSSGTFHVNLGSVCPFFVANACNGSTPIDFGNNPDIYLGITFNSDPAGEMTPRVKLQSVPFAFNSDRVGGLTANQLVQLSPSGQQTGSINVSGNIVTGAGLQGSTMNINSGALQVDGSGNVSSGGAFTVNNTTALLGATTISNSTSEGFVIQRTASPNLSAIMVANTSDNNGNLVINGDYEDSDTGGWVASGSATVQTSSDHALYGKKSLRINGGTGDGATYSLSGLSADTFYVASFYIRSTVSLADISIDENTTGTSSSFEGCSTEVTYGASAPAIGWTKYICFLDVGSTPSSESILIEYTSGSNDNIYLDGMIISESQFMPVYRSGGIALNSAVTSQLIVQPTQNSTSALSVREADSGAQIFNVDTVNNAITLGSLLGDNSLSVSGGKGTFISGAIEINGYAGVDLSCGANKGIKSIKVTKGIVTDGVCTTNTLTDLAEQFNSLDALGAGEVVSIDPSNSEYVKRTSSAYQKELVGVVSTAPNITLGEDNPGYPIALAGRVPVKITNENGVVQPGDYLTSSNIPGVAMKATGPGPTIGKAMTADDGSGKVIVFVNLSFIGLSSGGLSFEGSESLSINSDLSGDVKGISFTATPYNTDYDTTGLFIGQANGGGAHGLDTGIRIDNANQNSEVGAALEILNSGGGGYRNIISSDNFTINGVGDLSTKGSITAHNSLKIVNTSNQEVFSIDSSGSANLAGALNAQSLNLGGGLNVAGDVDFAGLTTFQKLATFIGRVVFKQDIEFERNIIVSNNTAGYAVIKSGESLLHVSFQNPYPDVPIVSIGITNGKFAKVSVNNVTANGFDIVVSEPSNSDVQISWTALQVRDPKTTVNQ